MSFGGPSFIVAIVLIMTLGWVLNNWIRARHGYPLEDEWSGKTYREPTGEMTREVESLSKENAGLRSQVSRLEERIAVLERIATDPAERTAREIEKLR